MAFKSREPGFFYEYKKNRPRLIQKQEPEKKKTWLETFLEERNRLEQEKQKAKEKARQRMLDDEEARMQLHR